MDVHHACVSMHPTAYTCDNVYGYVYVSSEDATMHAKHMGLGFRVPDQPAHPFAFHISLAELQSIREHAPSAMRPIGYVEIVSSSHKPQTLFYHKDPFDDQRSPNDWAGHRLIDALVPFVDVLASRETPHLFLLDPTPEDRARHQTPHFADDAIDAVLSRRSPLPPQKSRPDTLTSWAKSTHMSVLTQLSHVVRGARDSRDAILAHPLVRRAKPHVSTAQAGPYMVSAQSSTPLLSPDHPSLEFDAARVYLAKWASQVAKEGELNRIAEHAMDDGPERDAESLLGASNLPILPASDDKIPPLSYDVCTELLNTGAPAHAVAQQIFRFGLASNARALMWPYLMGALPLESDVEKRRCADGELASSYEAWMSRWFGHAVTSDTLEASRHRIWIDCLRADTKHAFFLTDTCNKSIMHQVNQSGWNRPSPQGSSDTQVNPHLYVLSNILWTFEVYAEHAHDPLLPHVEGYVQGMSDLCSVCYVACEGDEPRTFWTFVAVMRQWGCHYVADQSGMRHELLLLQRLVAELCPRLYEYLQQIDGLNLFFCFRWLLVCFKREFELHDVFRIWEAVWSAGWSRTEHRGWPLCSHLHLFVALAILESHERLLIRHLRSFDEVLMFIHSLAFHMDATSVLRRAEALVYRLRSRVVQGNDVDSELRSMVLC